MEICSPWGVWGICSTSSCSVSEAAILGAYLGAASGLLLAAMVLLRVWMILSLPDKRWKGDPARPLRTMVVLGSGGHTAEMLTLLPSLGGQNYSPRCYVVAATDSHSAEKALKLEQEALKKAGQSAEASSARQVSVQVIPRSREVGQSFLSSIWTTLIALASASLMVVRYRPDLVLVNGPGTCIPVCFSAFVLRLLWLSDSRIVFIESIARVKSLSLSGKILYHLRMADLMLVQWPQLCAAFPRTQYAGRLF